MTNNYISEVPEISNINLLLQNQMFNKDINININKNNRIELPSIIKKAYENRFKHWEFGKNSYEDQTRFETKNCEIDFINNQIIINSDVLGEGIATITIKGGSYAGTTYTINYNAQEELELVDIEVKKLPNKLIYIEGENFDENGMNVQEIYENEIREEVNDYIIVDGENLNSEQQSVTIRSNKNPELETKVDITVYAEDELIEAQFPDDNLYNAIKDGSAYVETSEEIKQNMILSYNDDTNTLLMLKNKLEQISTINLISKNIKNISGIECFTNLKIIYLNDNKDLEKVDELIGLNKLELVDLSFTKVNDIKDLLNKESIRDIGIYKNTNEVTETYKQEVILPEFIYQMLTMQQEYIIISDAVVYYEVEYNENIGQYMSTNPANNKNIAIEVDNERQIATVELDKEITEEKKEGIRQITINIVGGKTGRFYYDIVYNTNFEEVLEINIEEYQEEQDGDIKYINNINLGVTVSQILDKIQANDSATKEVYDETTKVAANGILATGMKIIISLNSQIAEYIAVVSGDINGDAQITATDLTKMKNHILEKSTLTDLAFKAADLNNDGQITATELTKIKKYVLGFDIQLH